MKEKRTIRVQGRAVVSGERDLVILRFSLNSKAMSYGTSLESMYKRVEMLRQELESVGVDRTKLKTSNLSVSPHFESVKDKYVFSGYVASQNMKLELPMDRQHLNQVLDGVTDSKSGAEMRISFGLRDESALRQRALEEAVANARKNAETLANAAGVKLGKLLQVDYGWSEVYFRSELEESSGLLIANQGASDAPNIEPEGARLEDSVTMIWEMDGNARRA